ncbi:hypothetical protein H0266_19285 [Halobacillus locisalis]|uniref:Uncharacterized protein n=1 Tax=Halobacillus locisalis TaxID=220753 RepID=A0A838CZ31_9BACI|nr:hypothetical protein [Halobacillus locisalis]MBA2177021.1 hypothetical protein [Halobacillus locisalis]
MEAAFPFLLGKWMIWDSKGKVMGELKANFSLFTKKYTYKTNTTTYPIDSPAFSGEYTIYNEKETVVATFKKVNGVFQASAYELYNQSETLLTEELIAVVMGINANEKEDVLVQQGWSLRE